MISILRNRPWTILTMVSAALTAATASAHPGHATFDQGASHALTSQYHVATMVLAGAALLLVGQLVSHAAARAWLRRSGIVVLLASLAVWKFRA